MMWSCSVRKMTKYLSQRQNTYLRKSAPGEDSDQLAHMKCIIRIITRRFLDSEGCKVSSCGERRLPSDCADAQSDESLRWAHMSKGTFSHV